MANQQNIHCVKAIITRIFYLTALIIPGLLTGPGCTTDRSATLRASVHQPEVYNDILNELVKNHFYNLYLGPDFEQIEQKFHFKRDSPEYKREVEKLRMSVDSDTSKQSGICIRNKFSSVRLSQLSIDNFNDSIDNPGDPRNIIKIVSTDYKHVYDSLTTPQEFSADYFQTRSFKVNTKPCKIGIICFSKVFFNKQGDKGLLYYEFICGEKCGKGEILVIENKAGDWTIEKNLRLWIL